MDLFSSIRAGLQGPMVGLNGTSLREAGPVQSCNFDELPKFGCVQMVIRDVLVLQHGLKSVFEGIARPVGLLLLLRIRQVCVARGNDGVDR